MSSSSVKGRGADCIGFVSKVVDELYRTEFGVLAIPSPVGLSHQHQKFVDFYRRTRKLWPVKLSRTVDCGDIILDRPSNGHAHLYICGPTPYTVWHCLNGEGVCFSGFGSLGQNLTLFKMLNKHQWV